MNSLLYTHLSGETRTVGRHTYWLDCFGSGQSARTQPAAQSVVEPATVPDQLRSGILATQGENHRRIRHLEDLIQIHKDWMIRPGGVRDGNHRARIEEHTQAVGMMRAENELLSALLAS
jgi:hypothetical protein